MIPVPGHPTQEQASRAMSQADEFVRRTRAEAQAQIDRQHQTYTGGQQPGVLTYAGHAAAMTAGATMRAGQGVIAGGATAMGVGAAMAQPMTQQIMMAGAGARPGQMPQGLMGLMTTAYAPRWLLPHAGTAFGMERAVRQEFAGEELGRRWDMFGRRAATTAADLMSFGVTSHIMRRTGMEARLFTEMQTERTLQRRMGALRGMGGYSGATGFGVRRGFLTEGPGREAMEELTQGAGGLQAAYGYSGDQLGQLTEQAAGAIDPSRMRRMGGRQGGMRQLGREIREIRDTLARTARELQLTEEEMPKFFEQLKSTMQVTGEGFRSFREETRNVALQGPFTQRQAAQMGMQYMQFGRGQFFDPTRFRGEAYTRALEVAELRERGVINRETLLREGGGLDQAAMQQMLMQRLQVQAQAVQGGQFNQAMILAGGNMQGYNAMMQGGGFFQTQGAVAATIMQNPFALLQARTDPSTRQRVTMDAQLIAFRETQQRARYFIGSPEARRAQAISAFGQRFGMAPEQAQPWFEEQELQLGGAERMLNQMGVAQEDPTRQRSLATFAVGFGRRTGERMRNIVVAMRSLGAGLGEGPAEWEENIVAFRERAVVGNVDVAIGKFRQPFVSQRGAFMAVAAGKPGDSLAMGPRSAQATAALERYELAQQIVRGTVDPTRVRAFAGRLRAAGLPENEISQQVLGSADVQMYTRTHESPRNFFERAAQYAFGADMTSRMWVELQGDELKLMRQEWTPTEDQRSELEGLGKGVPIPQKYIEGKAGWSDPVEVDDPIRLAEIMRTARQDPVTGLRLAGLRRLGEISGGPAIGALRSIVGPDKLPQKLTLDRFSTLLDLDTHKDLFKRVEGQTSLAPMARVIQAFTATGQLQQGGYEELRTAIPLQQMQRLTQRFAAKAGIDVRADYAADADKFQEFMGKLGPLGKDLATQMLQLATARSDRLAKATPLGSPGNKMWVQWERMHDSGPGVVNKNG